MGGNGAPSRAEVRAGLAAGLTAQDSATSRLRRNPFAEPLGFRAREGRLRRGDHVVRRAELFRQRDRVTRVLVHEIEREIGFIELALDHAREFASHDRACRGAGADEGGDLLGRETGFPGEGQRLGEACRLNGDQHVVDELPGRPGPRRADVVDAEGDRLHGRPRRFNRFRVAADKEGELARCGGGPAAADRRVEETAAPLFSLAGELAHPVGRQRARTRSGSRPASRSRARPRARARRRARRRRPRPSRQ